MMKKLAAILGTILILSSFLFPLASCKTEPTQVVDFSVIASELGISEESLIAIDFSVRLFQQSVSSERNSLISPFSVLCALAMVTNGADGNTRTQMEHVLGFSVTDLNRYIYSYMQSLSSESDCKFNIANSIWFKDTDSLTIYKDFLQVNADYYSATINKAPFNSDTLKAINNWVSDNTDGMIKNILNEIPAEAVMYLINALVFDAEWQKIYNASRVRTGTFTTISNEKHDVQMMYSEESIYLDDGNATGFIKYYSGGKYAFAALLPNEGMSIDKYIRTLTGQGLALTLHNAQNIQVHTATPKFESEYSIEMKDILSLMGMRDAFDSSSANLTKLGTSTDGPLYISRVAHKTFISVDERGTKAGAVTDIEVYLTGGMVGPEPKTVHLDRPFVYMIIDCETNLPIFIGTVLDI